MKKNETIDTNRIVHVDLGKLSEGLALTFGGVTKVFESLGAEAVPGFGTVSAVEGEKGEEAVDTADTTGTTETTDTAVSSAAEKRTAKTASKKPAKTQNEPEKVEDEAVGKTDAEAAEPTAQSSDNGQETAQETVQETREAPAGDAPSDDTTAAGENVAGGSPFTLNDIMKIAAQKMAKDAGVTEKIGALVKTYGVSTLKELPEEKFEAFMTDLTQI